MIICDKCLSKCGKRGKIELFKTLLHFWFLLHFALYRGKRKMYKNLTQNVVNFFNMVYVGGLV